VFKKSVSITNVSVSAPDGNAFHTVVITPKTLGIEDSLQGRFRIVIYKTGIMQRSPLGSGENGVS
jgi:hypothetical protein